MLFHFQNFHFSMSMCFTHCLHKLELTIHQYWLHYSLFILTFLTSVHERERTTNPFFWTLILYSALQFFNFDSLKFIDSETFLDENVGSKQCYPIMMLHFTHNHFSSLKYGHFSTAKQIRIHNLLIIR